MEAAPLVQQHALGPLEDDRSGSQQPRQVAAVHELHPAAKARRRRQCRQWRGGERPDLVGEPVAEDASLRPARGGRAVAGAGGVGGVTSA